MSAALFDVNVLLALLDPAHLDHDRAQDWFALASKRQWATCPITQNGYVRIASQPRYGNSIETGVALELIREMTTSPNHQFWADDVSLLNEEIFSSRELSSPRRVTDTYLLGLAARNKGQLATMDRRLRSSGVVNGDRHLVVIA